jgi:hypothetical protein
VWTVWGAVLFHPFTLLEVIQQPPPPKDIPSLTSALGDSIADAGLPRSSRRWTRRWTPPVLWNQWDWIWRCSPRSSRVERKLTPRECFNLQGFPTDYVLPATVSDSNSPDSRSLLSHGYGGKDTARCRSPVCFSRNPTRFGPKNE